MDLRTNLFASRKRSQKGVGKASLFSLTMHVLLISSVVVLGATASHKVDAEEKIKVFITQGAAPPPPPPPPPPPAASSSAPKSTPTIKPTVEPVRVQESFVAPVETPKEVPQVETPYVQTAQVDLTPSEAPSGVAGGVVGGVQGGVVGGEVGGVHGGQLGGVVGGEIGGVLGGEVGGTGTGTVGEGTGGNEAPPDRPVRVGGDVKAPVVTSRTEPKYTEVARNARVAGIVIVEAIIDRHGNVDRVKVIKGLPMGLGEEAERAVRQWKFKPGTLNGQPVDVIFNLTVNFKLG